MVKQTNKKGQFSLHFKIQDYLYSLPQKSEQWKKNLLFLITPEIKRFVKSQKRNIVFRNKML